MKIALHCADALNPTVFCGVIDMNEAVPDDRTGKLSDVIAEQLE
ncbi:TPA: hypothetical protein ACTXEN_001909 [Raoultella planticola]|nr:hypothetical protein [Klebsiella quasipneumoniae]